MLNSARLGTQDLGIAVKLFFFWTKKWNECGVNVNPVSSIHKDERI